jgi:hypothetical protein
MMNTENFQLRRWCALWAGLCFVAIALVVPTNARAADYVIHISIDGLNTHYLQTLIDTNQAPNFKRLQLEGAWTHNARTDYDYTITLPNHATMLTGRPVAGVAGHNWIDNGEPGGATLHGNKGSYVASVYDVAHDAGLRTGLYAGKTKFSLFNNSYNVLNGAPDTTGADNGRDKIDTYIRASAASMTTQYLDAMQANPFHYSFLHYAEPDDAGHSMNWGSTTYMDAVKAMDGHLGQLLGLVESQPALQGRTVIILSSDHGGRQGMTTHSEPNRQDNYTVPFYVWGAGVTAGADLYALNTETRLDPGTGRPTYADALQPIRAGDGGNLALSLLGLGAIPGSTINASQSLVVPEPASIGLGAAAGIMLLRRRRR